MWRVLIAALGLAQMAGAGPLDGVPQTRLADGLRCHLGVYQLADGETIALTGANGAPRGLAYTLSDGRFATLSETADGAFAADGISLRLGACAAGEIVVTRADTARIAKRRALVETPTRFTSDGNLLNGKLIMPADGKASALAVWIEGSNNNPSTDDAVWPYELARRGIGVFVYDKRGTGASSGALTANFAARARDTAAAIAQARRLAPGVSRVGVIGGSQGGWVAPLTATLTPLDFVVPAFALAQSPIGQDQDLVQLQLRQAGFVGADLRAAQDLTALTAQIVRTNSDAAFAALDAFKAAHSGAAWMKAIQPRSYTGLFLMFTSEQIKQAGPAMAQGLQFDYEPRPVIETIKPRQLWLLAGQDQQAPSAATQSILREIQTKRGDLDVVVFAKADHGLIEATADGTGKTFSAQVFDITADWIKSGKMPAAGRFVTLP